MAATNLTIAVDIDGTTITEICTDWYNSLKNDYFYREEWEYLKYQQPIEDLPYNLASMFKVDEESYFNGFEFFDNAHLYDNYAPRTDALSVINQLITDGNDVVFVSRIMGCHEESKRKWVNKWFPKCAFIATDKKKYISCDYIIDDSLPVLNEMPLSTSCIRFRQDYTFPVAPQRSMKTVYNFYEAYDFIQSREGDWT